MNSTQLANVLIKVLGLSICVRGIPSFVAGFLLGLFSPGAARSSPPGRTWAYTVGAAVELAIGIFFLVRSRKVAERLFGAEASAEQSSDGAE